MDGSNDLLNCIKEIINNIYSNDDKCYKYETINTKCNEDAIA